MKPIRNVAMAAYGRMVPKRNFASRTPVPTYAASRTASTATSDRKTFIGNSPHLRRGRGIRALSRCRFPSCSPGARVPDDALEREDEPDRLGRGEALDAPHLEDAVEVRQELAGRRVRDERVEQPLDARRGGGPPGGWRGGSPPPR